MDDLSVGGVVDLVAFCEDLLVEVVGLLNDGLVHSALVLVSVQLLEEVLVFGLEVGVLSGKG